VDIEQWIGGILGGGLLGSLMTWWTSRHRPKVDTAQVILSGQNSFIDQLQEERDRLDKRIDAVEARATEAERASAQSARYAADVESMNNELMAQNMALADHHLATVRGVIAGTVPPWLVIPSALAQRLSEADYPPWPPRDQSTKSED